MARADRMPRQRLTPEQRRVSIISAASKFFAERPFEQVGLDDVAQASGASKALILKYFGSKADLYAAVVGQAIVALDERQTAAFALLPDDCAPIERVRTAIESYLDHIEQHPRGWSAPLLLTHPEPGPAAKIRTAAREVYVDRLARLFNLDPTTAQAQFALWSFYALLDGACLRWVARGCRLDERAPLVTVATNALLGAISGIKVASQDR